VQLSAAGSRSRVNAGPRRRLQWVTDDCRRGPTTNLRMKKNESKIQISEAIKACLEKKAEEITILELEQGSGAFTDYFVVCSGAIHARCRRLPTKWNFV